MGVRFPLPAPTIRFIFSGLGGMAVTFSDTSGTESGTVRIFCIFNKVEGSLARTLKQQSIYSWRRLRSITECAADCRSACDARIRAQ